MKMIVVIIIIILVCGVLTISCCSLISLLGGGGIFLSLENEKQEEENEKQEEDATIQSTKSISNVSKTTLHKLVKKYYDEKGPFKGIYKMGTIEDSNVVSSNELDVRYKYIRVGSTTPSGTDYRRFVFSLSPLNVTKVNDYQSGKTVAPDSDKEGKESALDAFTLKSSSYGQAGRNDKVLFGKTAESCAKACLDETSFNCKSFDLHTNGKCYLSKDIVSEGGSYNKTATGFKYYQKTNY